MSKIKLGVFSCAASLHALRRLRQEAEKRGIGTELINYRYLDFKISTGKAEVFFKDGKTSLPSFDLIIPQAVGFSFKYAAQRNFLISLFKEKGSTVLNEETYLKWPELDKITQHVVLARGGGYRWLTRK